METLERLKVHPFLKLEMLQESRPGNPGNQF
jgi:hypothetical protein